MPSTDRPSRRRLVVATSVVGLLLGLVLTGTVAVRAAPDGGDIALWSAAQEDPCWPDDWRWLRISADECDPAEEPPPPEPAPDPATAEPVTDGRIQLQLLAVGDRYGKLPVALPARVGVGHDAESLPMVLDVAERVDLTVLDTMPTVDGTCWKLDGWDYGTPDGLTPLGVGIFPDITLEELTDRAAGGPDYTLTLDYERCFQTRV